MVDHMKEKNYWRLISLAPLILPLVLFVSPMLWTRLSGGTSPPASITQIFSLGTLFIAGIPYFVFLVITQLIIWSRPIRWDRIASLVSPPAFLLIFLAGFQIYWSISGVGGWLDSPRTLSAYSLLVLVVGYLFVGLGWFLLVILRIFGVIDREKRMQGIDLNH